jgi:epoxyqueuosine reductase
MISKISITEKARELGFEDTGFTTAEPFESQRKLLRSMDEEYQWISKMGLDLAGGTDPKTILPEARSIIVLMEAYFRESFPASMEAHFGRCYLDDDRVTKDGLAVRIKAFRKYLRDNGIDSKVPFNLPHRLSAARAGMGTFGKNCLFYSNNVALGGSWVLPIAVVVDRKFEPDEPTLEVECPDWCKNACIAACPTGALKGPRKIDPRKCISFLTYFGEGLTPMELREPMGLWVYGCDRCQNVCPRNSAWLAQKLPPNKRVVAMTEDFDLLRLLHMNGEYFEKRIWPHMFYMSPTDLWRWKMNVARAMGNSLNPEYIPHLIRAFRENNDERVTSMCAWALGRIGGAEAGAALKDFLNENEGQVRGEILQALEMNGQAM